jgi:HK97 gp10 family phage protein
MQVSVQVTGLRELERKLVALGPKVGLKAMRSALVSGAQVIKKDALNSVPVKTGRLRRSILIKRLAKLNPFSEKVIIGVRHGKKYQKTNRDAYYWKFLEFGHKDRAGKMVDAQPFIRPAFEAQKTNAMNRIIDVLKKKISQYAKEPA